MNEPGSPGWRPGWAAVGRGLTLPPLPPLDQRQPLARLNEQLGQVRIAFDAEPITRYCAAMTEAASRAAVGLNALGAAMKQAGQTKR